MMLTHGTAYLYADVHIYTSPGVGCPAAVDRSQQSHRMHAGSAHLTPLCYY